VLTKKDKHLAAAQKFLERGQHDRALEEFARVVQEDAGDTRTWLKMAEIHAQRGALDQARDIYLRTAEIYVSQGFLDKAATVYKSVLKLTPGVPQVPQVRERLGDVYRQLGRVADALRELENAAGEFIAAGRPAEALPALRRIVGLHPDNVGSRVKLAETASQTGALDEAVHELRRAAEQLKLQGRADEFVRVAERLSFHCPDDFGVARELAAAYIARRNPRQALTKLQAPLRAAPRDPANVALLAEALAQLDRPKAISVWRELADIHEAAGRAAERDACVRAALALDPTDGETRELAARWGVATTSPVRPRPAPAASMVTPPPLPASVSGLRPVAAPPRPGPAPEVPVSVSGLSALSGLSGLPSFAVSGLITTPSEVDVARILSEADVFVKYGLAERAVDHLKRVFAAYPQHRGARERLASVLSQLGRRAEAAAELATLAAHLAAEGDADAPGVAERALTLDPSCEPAAKMLGRKPAPPPSPGADELAAELEQVDFFLDQSLVDEARGVLDELDKRFPGHKLLADKRRAVEAAARHQQEEEEEDTDAGAVPGGAAGASQPAPIAQLSVSEKADPGTHGDLGIAYKQMGLHDAAIAEFKQVLADRSRAVFALTMMGECLEAKGELGEAVVRYKEALNQTHVSASESLELYYLLGGVFERLGDVREALYFFENLRKRDAHFRDVERRIATLKPMNETATANANAGRARS
jgi:tetratricopeptide (TPR) repeat protein